MERSKEELEGVVAAMESKIDLLESELSYLDKILTDCGFQSGVATLKETLEELLVEQRDSKFKE